MVVDKLYYDTKENIHFFVVQYDVSDDIREKSAFQNLKNIYGLFQNAQLDASRTRSVTFYFS